MVVPVSTLALVLPWSWTIARDNTSTLATVIIFRIGFLVASSGPAIVVPLLVALRWILGRRCILCLGSVATRARVR